MRLASAARHLRTVDRSAFAAAYLNALETWTWRFRANGPAAVLAGAPGVVRASASPTKRIAAGAVLTVVAVGMLVAAVFANLEGPT